MTLFNKFAGDAFSFLEEFGFALTEIEPTSLRYESDRGFVVTGWDPHSGELDVGVGLRGRSRTSRDTFSLTDVLAMDGASQIPYQVPDEARLKPFLDMLAQATRAYARLVASGDDAFFERLSASRADRAAAYTEGLEIDRIRNEAQAAWQKRQFDLVARLYQSIESHLSEAERLRLRHSQKHRTP